MGLIKLHLVIAERSGQPHIDLFGGTASLSQVIIRGDDPALNGGS